MSQHFSRSLYYKDSGLSIRLLSTDLRDLFLGVGVDRLRELSLAVAVVSVLLQVPSVAIALGLAALAREARAPRGRPPPVVVVVLALAPLAGPGAVRGGVRVVVAVALGVLAAAAAPLAEVAVVAQAGLVLGVEELDVVVRVVGVHLDLDEFLLLEVALWLGDLPLTPELVEGAGGCGDDRYEESK